MLTHLRNNAIAYLALFVALGGTSAAAVALEDNSVLSKHIKNGAVKKPDLKPGAVDSSRVKDGALTPADRAPGFGSVFAAAAHNHDARYVNEGQLDAVGAGMIADPQRSVSVPLGSFNDCQGSGDEIDFASGGDDRADFASDGSGHIVLRFDDDSGEDDSETRVCSGITVPPDYAGGGGLRATVAKVEDTGGSFGQTFDAKVGSDAVGIFLTEVGVKTEVMPLPTALAPDQALPIHFSVRREGGNPLSDSVTVHAVDFVYRSKQ